MNGEIQRVGMDSQRLWGLDDKNILRKEGMQKNTSPSPLKIITGTVLIETK